MASQSKSRAGSKSGMSAGSKSSSSRSTPAKRGFAAMSPEKQRQIASMGGKAAHEKGTAHEFTSEEARAAGRKGGAAISKNRAHMAAIGRKGGASSSRSSAPRSATSARS